MSSYLEISKPSIENHIDIVDMIRIIKDTPYEYEYEDDEEEYDYSKDISLNCYDDYSHGGIYCY